MTGQFKVGGSDGCDQALHPFALGRWRSANETCLAALDIPRHHRRNLRLLSVAGAINGSATIWRMLINGYIGRHQVRVRDISAPPVPTVPTTVPSATGAEGQCEHCTAGAEDVNEAT